MFVFSSNLRNLPDLTADQFAHDARMVKGWAHAKAPHTGVLGAFQEIEEPRDHAQLHAIYPAKRWHTLNHGGENVGVATRRCFKVHERGVEVLHAGKEGVSPHREREWAAFSKPRRRDLLGKRLLGVFEHYVSGAYSHPGQTAEAWRLAMWLEAWDEDRAWVKARQAEGFTVVRMGDFNRVGLPKLTHDTRSLAAHGLDHITVAPGRNGIHVRAQGTQMVLPTSVLFTDHAALGRRIALHL